MNRQALKDEQDCSFWSPAKRCKGFKEINYIVKSYLQKWIICHQRVMQSTIFNYYITVKFDDGNGGLKTELSQKVLLQVYVHELHMDMLERCDQIFHGIW